jgi:hypothetical protein
MCASTSASTRVAARSLEVLNARGSFVICQEECLKTLDRVGGDLARETLAGQALIDFSKMMRKITFVTAT